MVKNLMKVVLVGLAFSVIMVSGWAFAESHKGPVGKGPVQGHVQRNDKYKAISRDEAARIARNTHKGSKVLSIEHNKNLYIVRIANPVGKWLIFIDDKSGRIVREDREKYHPGKR